MRLVSTALPAVGAYLVVMVIASVLADTQDAAGSTDLLVSVLNIAAGFYMTKALIESSGLVDSTIAGGFWTYLGIGILTGIAIAFGLLLLIVPGLVLAVRWAPVYGYALAEGESVTEAMGKAWTATGDHFVPILLTLLMPFALSAVAIGAYFFGADESGLVSLPFSLAANVMLYSATIVSTVIGLACYALLRERAGMLADVFE